MPFLRFVITERSRSSGDRHGFLRGAELVRGRSILSVHEPGFIVYEDALHVVAEPFSGTPT
jgi:hypothetical protein